MATPQGRRLGYHTPEQVSNQEPPDSRPCVLTTTLLGGGTRSIMYARININDDFQTKYKLLVVRNQEARAGRLRTAQFLSEGMQG